MTPVYTYFNPVPLLSLEDETKLIIRWRRSWLAHGFTPIVLNQWSIQKHPLYNELTEKIGQLPSVNPAGYESACYMRWLALAQAGGGIMTDYDVMNYGWTPYKTNRGISELGRLLKTDLIWSMQKYVPSVVVGSAKAFLGMVQYFLNYRVTGNDLLPEDRTRPHISDMLMLEKLEMTNPDSCGRKHIVRDFHEDGWESSLLVHFNTSSMTANHLPRWKHIPLLRP